MVFKANTNTLMWWQETGCHDWQVAWAARFMGLRSNDRPFEGLIRIMVHVKVPLSVDTAYILWCYVEYIDIQIYFSSTVRVNA